MDIKKSIVPHGELVIKTLAMPNDTNSNGDIFGGWVLSQMDIGAGIIAKGYSPSGRAVTVAIDRMEFINPIKVGQAVSCFAHVTHCGNTSMNIAMETWVYDYETHESKIVTRGIFTYVAIGLDGKPIKLKIPKANNAEFL